PLRPRPDPYPPPLPGWSSELRSARSRSLFGSCPCRMRRSLQAPLLGLRQVARPRRQLRSGTPDVAVGDRVGRTAVLVQPLAPLETPPRLLRSLHVVRPGSTQVDLLLQRHADERAVLRPADRVGNPLGDHFTCIPPPPPLEELAVATLPP